MTGTLTIAARELRERSFVFVTAAVLSLIPLISPMLPITRNGAPLLVIMVMGCALAIGFGIALSIVMGGSMVARELADKRLSFYFSKPVSASSIWFGKVIGAIVTIAVCCAITFIPALLVAHRELEPVLGLSGGELILALAITATSLLLISHAVNTAMRSRSPLVVLDLALFVGGVVLVWRIIRPLAISGAIRLVIWVSGSVLLMLPITILAAGAWQLSRGRTDLRRSHRELSRFFWTTMTAVILVAASYVAWVFSAGPRDVRVDGAVGNAAADWIALSGPASHRGDYTPAFLVDLKTGQSIRISRSISPGVFTRSGNATVTIDPVDLKGGRGEIHVHQLEPRYSDHATGITTPFWSSTVLSDDLRRMAVFEPGVIAILSVHDLPSKTMMGSVRIPFGTNGEAFFVSNDVVRLYARPYRGSNLQPVPQEIRIYEFNAKTRQLVQTGSVTSEAKWMFLRLSPDGSMAIVNEYGGKRGARLRFVDGRTGAERAAVEGYAPFSVTPLTDGGAAFVASKDGLASVRILDAHAQLVREIPLGTQGHVGSVRELIPGQKYVASLQHKSTDGGGNWSLYVVDAPRGVVERVEHNALLRTPSRGNDPRIVTPSRSGEYVITDATNALWRWNALTGSKVKVF